MGDRGILPRTLLLDDRFDWVYVVDVVVAVTVAIFFLFYFNRMFGRLVSYAIRKYTWYNYRVYVDFKALQVSPLAGRVFFKGFRYHARNETILINDGYITWRYWLRRVRTVDLLHNSVSKSSAATPGGSGSTPEAGNGERASKGSQGNLPCRISVKVRGLECYLYNRTPAYDTIAESISKMDAADDSANCGPATRRKNAGKGDVSWDNLDEKTSVGMDDLPGSNDRGQKQSILERGAGCKSTPPTSTTGTDFSSEHSTTGHDPIATLPIAIRMLPIKLDCSKGAVVLGNQHCRSILTAKFDQATGFVDASSASNLDLYKQTIDLDFSKPLVQFKTNNDFKDSLLAEGARIHKREQDADRPSAREFPPKDQKEKRHFWTFLRYVMPHTARSRAFPTEKHVKPSQTDKYEAIPGQQRWLGLTRYMDDEEDALEQERWKNVEYGQFPTVVDAPSIGASIRWDVPGQVSKDVSYRAGNHSEGAPDVNGAEPPDWSIDLRVRGGEIHAGPWADRQRNELQSIFFPTLFVDATPAVPLAVGQPRISTMFKLVVEIEERTTFVIHTREESKDWKWKGRASASEGLKAKSTGKKHRSKGKKGDKANPSPELRPPGWLRLDLSRDSSLTLHMDLVARPTGYQTKLVVDLQGSEMASSVNHELLWRSESQLISCDLSSPLGWDTLRQWQISVQSNKLEVFLLRDHIFLLTDVVNDWSSGPTADYHSFVPFVYTVSFHVRDFKLFLNANDSNIIDKPADIDENTFLVIWGETLGADISIPLNKFRPTRNAIAFDIGANKGGFQLLTPRWNTIHTFLEDKDVASLHKLKILGSYEYCTTTSPSNTDVLRLDVHGDTPKINLYGFLVRYLMKLKDNYFGEDLHFRTLEEYHGQIHGTDGPNRDSTNSVPHCKLSNDLDVILKIDAENAVAILPARLYSASENVRLDISSIVADLRFTNYYMDLSVSFSPVALARGDSVVLQSSSSLVDPGTQMFIDGLEISGHRLFGLPPTEPTYVCNWDFSIGSITGECSSAFLRALLSSIKCFAFSFDDDENALPPLNPSIIHDVTFLRLSVNSIEVWLRLGPLAFLFRTMEITLAFNDWAGNYFSQHMNLHITELTLGNVGSQEALEPRNKADLAKVTQAYLGATIDIHMLKRNRDFEEDRRLQQSHLKLHDSRTNRTPWLLQLDQAPISATLKPGTKIRPPAMQFPLMPEPLTNMEGIPLPSKSIRSLSAKSSSRKSSFIVDKSWERNRTPRAISETTDKPEHHPSPHGYSTGKATKRISNADVGRLSSNLSPTGFVFSSAYKPPYFPLCGLQLDLQDVPFFSGQFMHDMNVGRGPLDGLVDSVVQEPTTERVNWLVEVNEGIRAFCTPTALLHAKELLDALQADDLTALLDGLQIDTMADVVSSLGERRGEARVTDVNVRIPEIQIRVMDFAKSDPQATQDRLGVNVDIKNLNFTARIPQECLKAPTDTASRELSMHMALDGVNCSILNTTDAITDSRVVVCFTIQEPVLWMVCGKKSVLDARLPNIECLTTSQGLDRVTFRGLQGFQKLHDIIDDYTQKAQVENLRVSKLVYHLSIDGEDVSDPPFLTRASYVLRSATNHLRKSDSWKMVSRLRHIFKSLAVSWQYDVFEQCRERPAGIPDDASARVIASLEHWRAWDVMHVKESFLMQKLFSKEQLRINPGNSPSVVSHASIRLDGIRLAMQSQDEPSELLIDKLILAFENSPSLSSGQEAPENSHLSASNMKIQANCAKATAHIDWSLCDVVETLGSSLRSRSLAEKMKFSSSIQVPSIKPTLDSHYQIHVVLSIETCIVNMDSPTLSSMSLSHGLKVSLLVLSTRSGMTTNLFVALDGATSEFTDHSKVLMQSNFHSSSVFASLEDQGSTTDSHRTSKVAVSCDKLSQKILQHPLIVIETLDILLRDEVSRIKQLVSSLHPHTQVEKEGTALTTKASRDQFLVTLAVDSYLVSLVILPALSYSVVGRAARSTIQHGLRHIMATLIDFDLKDHSHIFTASGRDRDKDIAALGIPPINGRFRLDAGIERKSAVFHSMIESIKLDASAIHALLVTLSRPEVGDLLTEIERETALLKQHFDAMFVYSEPRGNDRISKSSTILYDGEVLVAGLSIHASTLTSSAATRAGRLYFNLGCVQVKSTNRKSDAELALDFPELEIRLNTIKANLVRLVNTEEYPSGELAITAVLRQSSELDSEADVLRTVQVMVSKFEVKVNAESPGILMDIIGQLQDTLKTIELSHELDRLRTYGRTRLHKEILLPASRSSRSSISPKGSTSLSSAMYSLEIKNLCFSWNIGITTTISPGRAAEDLMLSIGRIDLSTKRDHAARLLIENFQLQMIPNSKVSLGRSPNSALLPEVVFNVAYLSTGKDRRMGFQAAGKSLDLRLNTQFILPAGDLRRSIAYAVQEVRGVTAGWNASASAKGTSRTGLLGDKKFATVLVDADFAGAVVYIQGRSVTESQIADSYRPRSKRMPQHGRYNQFTPGNVTSNTTLRAPGLAFKIEYKDADIGERSLSAEVKIDASSNVLHPAVVPLIMEISSSIQEMVYDPESPEQPSSAQSKPSKILDEDRLRSADPSAIFGNCRVNLGLRICRQEFSLTCQPIAQVDAVARFEDIYLTVNTVQSPDHGQFYTLSGVSKRIQASVQHAYSRDPTGSFDVESMVVSLMSSKHVSETTGLSVIIKISPVKAQINARQLQDFLLFREIWAPPEVRHSPVADRPTATTEPQAFIVQRYQQIAATGAFPWNATAVVAQLDIQLDLGQSLGRSSFVIFDLWVSSKKSSDWEQNLCLGFDKIGMDSMGRMSGLIELQKFRIRTSIQWPIAERMHDQTPLIQASLAFEHLRVKAAFDYQAFAIANILSINFLMYNVRELGKASNDRLVCIVKADTVQAFCTATSASQGLALYQAVERLIQEKQAAYGSSLKEIERYTRRRSAVNALPLRGAPESVVRRQDDTSRVPIKLQTKVIVRLGALNFGVYPNTFFDNQVFKIEALDASAQFSVFLDGEKIHSRLSLTLGQLRVALSAINRPSAPKKLGEITIDEVVACATSARGGTILKVPKVLATMQTWQLPASTFIDYIFTSSFQGNIDVGWNYSRISFLRGMFANHSRALAQRLGKPLPQSAVQITGGPSLGGGQDGAPSEGQEKITAVVNVPLSKYSYTALQEPVIDTPRLTQLGDATPPLEWIGLHRERLPNLTHQIVIVSLLEVAKEVEDAYIRILGSS